MGVVTGLCLYEGLTRRIVFAGVGRIAGTHIEVSPQRLRGQTEVHVVESELTGLTQSSLSIGLEEGTHPVDGVLGHGDDLTVDTVLDSTVVVTVTSIAGLIGIYFLVVMLQIDVRRLADDETGKGCGLVLHIDHTVELAVEGGLLLMHLPVAMLHVDLRRRQLLRHAVEVLTVDTHPRPIPVVLVGINALNGCYREENGVETVVDVGFLSGIRQVDNRCGMIDILIELKVLHLVNEESSGDGGVLRLHGRGDTQLTSPETDLLRLLLVVTDGVGTDEDRLFGRGMADNLHQRTDVQFALHVRQELTVVRLVGTHTPVGVHIVLNRAGRRPGSAVRATVLTS